VPALGDTVSVLLRVPAAADPAHAVRAVHLRTTPDAEQRFSAARPVRQAGDETWWQADLTIHNAVTTYRWLVEGGRTGYQWVTAAGVYDRDVTDAQDFRIVAGRAAPLWAQDAVVYQIYPDRFARSGRGDERPLPPWAIPMGWDEPVDIREDIAGRQLYGGDLDGIAAHLDHVRALGANCLYLTPVFPAGSTHRYDASTFDAVDPVLGGDAALARLTAAAHDQQIKVMGDITTNHCGVTHEWFRAASADPESPEHGFFHWRPDGTPQTWLDVPQMPTLNYGHEVLRDRMYRAPDSAIRRWLAPPYSLDGWRVDVANMTGRYGAVDDNQEVARGIRAAMFADNPQSLLVAEHTHDFTPDTPGDGWHGAMNYGGFTKPVWTWLRDTTSAPQFLGSPVRVPHQGGADVMATMRDFAAHCPWSVFVGSFTLLGSHDTTRIATLVGGDRALHEVAVGLLVTYPGIPMVTYGDEVGMEGAFGEDGRRPMPWGEATWDADLLDVYRRLIALRRSSVALRAGGLRWAYACDDVLVYLREAPGESALVHVSRAAHDDVRLPASLLAGIARGAARYGDNVSLGVDDVVLRGPGPQVSVWIWPTTGLS
jgi:alpha-glucosidase